MDCSTPGFPVFTISRSLLKLMSIEPVRQRAGKSGPQKPSLGPPKESPEAFTLPPSAFLVHAAHFLKQTGLGALGSIEEFPHLPEVSSQQAAASFLVLILSPSLLHFHCWEICK